MNRLALTFRTLFWRKPSIDSEDFVLNWEAKFGELHDPTAAEVCERIRFLGAERVLDFGAGYGRIAKSVRNFADVVCFEPNVALAQIARRNNFQVVEELNWDGLPDFDLCYSVRVMDYMSVPEIIWSLKRLSRITDLMVSWETEIGAAKLRTARHFAPGIQVVVNETAR